MMGLLDMHNESASLAGKSDEGFWRKVACGEPMRGVQRSGFRLLISDL